MADSKRCTRCGETKTTENWPPGKRWSDGLYPYCRDCKRAVCREWRERHKEELSRKAAAAYAANPEPAKARAKKRREADPERANRESREWARKNPDKRREITRRWQQANRRLVNEYTRKRYATRKGAKAIPFTLEQLDQRSAYYGGKCWICRVEATEWDHVIPLTKNGWHCLSNLRPICRRCNAVKRNKWPYQPT